MAKKDLTELVFILDRSGSMQGLESDTVGGYNSVLSQNRELPGEALVSTVLFDQEVTVVHDRVPIRGVRPMGLAEFRPRGCTALLDAVGRAITYHRTVQKVLPAGLRPERTLFVIVTDGYENASRSYTYEQVKRMIERQRELGWEFMFLAAGIDVAREASRLGVREDCAISYEATPSGTAGLYDAIGSASVSFRSGCGVLGTGE